VTTVGALLLNHLWQTTLFAVAIFLLTCVFRRDRANVRYALWFAASVKFLVPFAVLRWVGLQLPVTPWTGRAPVLPLATEVLAAPFSRLEFTAFPQPLEAAAVATSLAPHVWWLLLLLWAAGTSVVAVGWIRGWRALSRLRHSAAADSPRETTLMRRVEQRAGTRQRLTIAFIDAPLDPGVFGIWKPVLLWPASVSERLSDAQLEAIFAHELCHARRRDTVTAAVHATVEAVFWFHPLVWWMGGRMLAEREHACDDDVVRRGNDPGVYAESILRLGECLLEEQRAPAAAATTGADLKTRIERIMARHHRRSLGRIAQVGLAALAVCAMALPVIAGTLLPNAIGYGTLFFQIPRLTTAFAPRARVDAADASRARFASTHLTPSRPNERPGIIVPLAGGRLAARAVTVQQLVRYAYVAERTPVDAVIAGLPEWARTERFTVSAVARHPFVNDESGEPRELIAMLRHLLADRFALVTHEETRKQPVYALVRVSGTPGPPPSTSACWRPPDGMPPPGAPPGLFNLCPTTLQLGNGTFVTEGVSMRRFAAMIAQFPDVHRVVLDDTRLDGRFDVSIRWGASSENRTAPDTFLTALPRQLGLALEPRLAPIDVLVVDSVERPASD
jgi:uncharacterized protein (TIGR03435 family)